MDAVEPELVEQVETIAASVPEVQSVDRLRLRWLGHALEASMAITVDCDMTVAEGIVAGPEGGVVAACRSGAIHPPQLGVVVESPRSLAAAAMRSS